MKKLLEFFLLSAVVVCSMGANCGWVKSCDNQQVVPYPYMVLQPNYYAPVQYHPVVTQQVNWVPVVQNRVSYVPVVHSYYMNYGSYYYYPLYAPRYNQDPWQGYNY